MQLTKSKLLNNFSDITHSFTDKSGGVSKQSFGSLNLAFHVSDNKLDVHSNHQILADTLNYKLNSLAHMRQIHSDVVHIVNSDDNFSHPPTCDALITDQRDIPLMVMVADCAPILFYDDKQKVIAVAHAGRAGTFKNIVNKVVECFIHEFNSDAKDIYVSIGASIGSCCYEVGSEVKKEAEDLDFNYAIEESGDSYYLNIAKILKRQLIESGIDENNIEISAECTSCNHDTYFSYRKNSITGRFSGVIMLK